MFVKGDPGELVRTSVRVQNQTRVDARFDAVVFDADHGGDGDRVLDFLPSGSARRGAGAWLELEPSRFALDAGTEETVALAVRIPAAAGAGGHYAGIAFVASPTQPEAMFELDARAEIPVFVTVTGDHERDLRVHVRPGDRWRWSGGRATWTVDLHNAGDVHEVVEAGSLRVAGVLSGARSLALQPGILLPGERRTQELQIELRDAPDVWSAHASLEIDGTDTRAAADAALVTVLPWWLLAMLALAITVIAWRLRRRGRAADEYDWYDSDAGPSDPSAHAG